MEERKLAGLMPERVMYYFEEVCNIPRGSGNTGRISEYLAGFAREHSLEYHQDALGNVIIIKPASAGYEEKQPLMIQGHMDIVAVKDPDCSLDMEQEGVRLMVEGDAIYAEGSSLGADDGIALAYGMALLESSQISHPRLEVVFTVEEETGMDGARGIDLSMCQAARMLNLDSDEEGIFWTGCAGGAKVKVVQPLELQTGEGRAVTIVVRGLTGGHSGVDIHKGRGNANLLLGRILWKIAAEVDFSLAELSGGAADNAIPAYASAKLVVNCETDLEKVMQLCQATAADIKQELISKDGGVQILCEKQEAGVFTGIGGQAAKTALALLCALPGGVQAMSADIPDLVETSLNLGVMRLTGITPAAEKGELRLDLALRSSVESAKLNMVERIEAVARLSGALVTVSNAYPGWAFAKESPLRETMAAVYEQMYGKKPLIQAVHAGLECGFFAAKVPGLDCVSIGPNMSDIHTTKESLSISSAKSMWDYLIALLAVV